MNLVILGAGAWGTALALHFFRLGHAVTLVPRRTEQALRLATERENAERLPGHRLPLDLQIGAELKPVLMEAELLILALPVAGTAAACAAVAAHRESSWRLRMVVTASKGIDPETLRTPTDMVTEALPDVPVGILSGPTNAEEVASGLPTAMAFASASPDAAAVQEALHGGNLRIYLTDDIRGVSLGAALKNVYAIGAGICDGLGLGSNAKAALLTRVLAEMMRVGTTLGGRSETFAGLSGFGDLVATAYGGWSRNRTLGEAIGRGQSLKEALEASSGVVEGVRTASALHLLDSRESVEAPILEQVYQVLTQGKDPRAALQELMARRPRIEAEV